MASSGRRDIEAIGADLDRLAGRVVTEVATDVRRELFRGTPKATGTSAAAWIPSIGAPDREIYQSRRGGAAAPRAAGEVGLAAVALANAEKPINVNITNNTIGASVAEDGTSVRGGRPYVAKSIQRGLAEARRRLGIDDI